MATLAEVADRAGVSTATASKVLSGSPELSRITAETKAVVSRAARDLRYQPHPIARSLRTKRTHTIGFLTPNVNDSHLGGIIKGVHEGLVQQGYHLLVSASQKSLDEESFWIEYFRRRVDGFLVAVGQFAEKAYVCERLAGIESLPLVLVGAEPGEPRVRSVSFDNVNAARQAVNHLLDLGHRAVAFIAGSPEAIDSKGRLRGYRAALEEHGIAYCPGLVIEEDWIDDCSQGSAKGLLTAYPEITAILAFSDLQAIGTIKAAQELGRRVPETLSVVGFGDFQWGEYVTPALTTVRQPRLELGRAAAKLLLECIAERNEAAGGKGVDSNAAVPQVVLQPELLIRGSTAPPHLPG